MKNLVYGIIIGILILTLSGYLFLKAGGMPVSTKGNPLPLERFVARTALHAAMAQEINKRSPVSNEEPNLIAGAKIYVKHCSVCHGQEGADPTAISRGLFPHPPELLESDHWVTDDPVGETYWKVRNGIRLTGMPGFVDSLSDTEMWQVSQLLFYADKLPPSVHTVLKNK